MEPKYKIGDTIYHFTQGAISSIEKRTIAGFDGYGSPYLNGENWNNAHPDRRLFTSYVDALSYQLRVLQQMCKETEYEIFTSHKQQG